MPRHIRFAAAVVGLALIGLILFGLPFDGRTQIGRAQSQPRDPKAERVVQEGQAIATAQAQPRPPKDVGKPPRQAPGPAQPAALPRQAAGAGTVVESGLAPLPGSVYTIENRWFETRGGGELIVYAGAETQDPAQGVLVVRAAQANLGPSGVYPTPTRSGAVRVVGAVGERLQLQSASGTTFTFDVAARRFIGP